MTTLGKKTSVYIVSAAAMLSVVSLVGCQKPTGKKPSGAQRAASSGVVTSSSVKSTAGKPSPRKPAGKPTDALQKRAYAFVLAGDVLFGGTTAGVVAWTVGKGSERKKTADLVLSGSVQNMAVVPGGKELLVSTGPTGLARVDIRHAKEGTLAVRGHHPWVAAARQGCFSVWQAAPLAKGKRAVLACGTGGVGVASWGDRQDDPVVKQSRDVGGYVRDVAVLSQEGNRVVLAAAAGRAGVVVMKLEGGKLDVLKKVALPGEARALGAVGGRVYVAAGTAGLQVVDASKPKAAHVVGHFSPKLTDKARGIALDFAFSCVDCLGNRPPNDKDLTDRQVAYVCAGESGLWAVDVRDPSAPKLLGRYNPKRAMNRAVVSGDKLYAANDDGGVLVLDIRNPGKIKPISR